ncbi:hypothetical protein, partial [Paracoccus sp. 22332]|uniref:hypothetical protein n=1 Tax=Paracoccus sp. 22332 TaxID=3453913 RepID=UPI003F86A6AF
MSLEPICNILPIAPSTYYEHLAKRADPQAQFVQLLGHTRPAPRDPSGLRRELAGLWGSESLAAAWS